MSPARARTSRAAIVAAGREVLEERGLDGVSMASVARRVAVRPPSLYKHVRDRSALIAAIATDAANELAQAIEAAGGADDPPEHRLASMAHAFREFARRSPRATAMLFAGLEPGAGPSLESLARAARPVVDAGEALAGPAGALPAARALTAFAFQLGGNVNEAFEQGVAALSSGFARRA